MGSLETGTQQARESGLQAERTALAWNRTGLAVLVNALLAFRAAWISDQEFISVLAWMLLIAAGWVLLYGASRRRQFVSGLATSAPPTTAIAATAIIMLVTCIASIAAILVH